MNTRARIVILALAVLIALFVTLGCNGQRRYEIRVDTKCHSCDDYYWEGDDLYLICCGSDCADKVYYHAANVEIMENVQE
jgi:hypothetical protein